MPLVDLGKKLLEAAKLGQIENVEVLLLNGALFTTDWLGNTALHYAAQNGHVEMCQLLIRAGVNYDARTKVNRTPLHIATQEGHLAVVQLLISSGADIHSTDMIGMTALHWAVQKGYFDVVHLLMQHGANASLPNKFTKTPLDIAFDVGRSDLCQLLQLSPSADVDSAPVEEVTTTNTAERDIIDDIFDDNTVLCLPITLIQNSTAPLGIHQAATDGSVVTASVQNVITAVPQMSCHSVQLSSAAEDADVPPSSATSASTAVNNDDVGLTHSEDLVTLASLAEVTSTTNEHCKQMTESDTLTWLKTHGTAVDSSNLAMSTLNRGQTVVLTDAGKLVMHDVALATDITCFQHNVEVGKIDTADQIDTAASDDEDIEPLSKKSKCAKDATHQDRKLTEWQDCVTDSHKDSTCKPLLLNQELLEHS